MAALEKKKTSSTTVKYDSKKLSFEPTEYGNESWLFEMDKKNSVTFSIGKKQHGKVTKIDVSKDDGTIIVHISNDTYSTQLSKHSMDYKTIVAQLSQMCPTLMLNPKKQAPLRMVAKMLADFNGRCNFDYYMPLMARERPNSCEEITRDMLLKMLKRENELRLSKETLDELEKESLNYDNEEEDEDVSTSNDVFIPMSLIKCQEKVVKEFGYKTNEEMNYAIEQIRSARSRYPK